MKNQPKEKEEEIRCFNCGSQEVKPGTNMCLKCATLLADYASKNEGVRIFFQQVLPATSN